MSISPVVSILGFHSFQWPRHPWYSVSHNDIVSQVVLVTFLYFVLSVRPRYSPSRTTRTITVPKIGLTFSSITSHNPPLLFPDERNSLMRTMSHLLPNLPPFNLGSLGNPPTGFSGDSFLRPDLIPPPSSSLSSLPFLPYLYYGQNTVTPFFYCVGVTCHFPKHVMCRDTFPP